MFNIKKIKKNWFIKFFWFKTIVIATVLLLITFYFAKIFFWQKEIIASPNKVVETLILTKQDMYQSIRLLGIIHPKHLTMLTAKGSGTLDTLIPTGQKITKGMVIAKIDNSDVDKNLELYASTEGIAKAQFERLQLLLKKGFVSAKEVEEKKQIWIETQKALAKTKVEQDNLQFYAPFDGVVGAYKKREGSQVSQGEPIVTLYDPSSLTVDVDIPCSNLTNINEGQTVYVLGKKYVLTHLQKMLDEDTHMCPADVDITCDNCLIGSTIDVNLVVAEKKAVISIPVTAIFLRNSLPYVYIVKDGKVVLAAVKTGLKQQNSLEITEGLEAGDQVIIKGQDRLFPNMPVEIYHPHVKSM